MWILCSLDVVRVRLVTRQWASVTGSSNNVLYGAQAPSRLFHHSNCRARLDGIPAFGPNEHLVATPSAPNIDTEFSSQVHLCAAFLGRRVTYLLAEFDSAFGGPVSVVLFIW